MISILIFTCNAGQRFADLLDRLQTQTLKPSQIIVADSSSADSTVEVAQSRGCEVIVVDRNKFDHGATRTLLAKQAKGEILIFLTQDVKLFDNDTIKKLIEPLNSPDIAAVFGRQIAYPEASIYAEHLRIFNYSETSYQRTLSDKDTYGLKTVFFSNSFSAYRKSVIEEIGYFRDGLIFGEDTCAVAEILLKDKKIAYAAEAKVFHSHNYSICQDFKRYFDMGVFHKTESKLLRKFGKAESQGLRYIKKEFRFILKRKSYISLPGFLIRNMMKYTGYSLGKIYKSFPRELCKLFSMNKIWWDKME